MLYNHSGIFFGVVLLEEDVLNVRAIGCVGRQPTISGELVEIELERAQVKYASNSKAHSSSPLPRITILS